MASESLGTEDFPKLKHRWSDNIKVYTRKFKPKNNNNPILPNDVSDNNNNVVNNLKASTPTTATTACENEKITTNNVDNDNSLKENYGVSNGMVSDTNNEICGSHSSNKHLDDVNNVHEIDMTEDVPEKVPPYSPPSKVAVEAANSVQPQPDSPLPQQNSVRLRTASGDSTSFNRFEVVPLPNGNEENLVNGSVLRPFVSQVNDRLNISVSAGRSKEEVNDLKRKLENELDQVRKMVKRLKEKEVLIGGYSIIHVETTGPAVGHLQFPVNGGTDVGLGGGGGVMRMESETSSASFHDSRPFKHLSVSVTNNNHHHGFLGEALEKEKRTPKANQYYQNSEFLLGKDRLPPESNRKSKSAGSKRHGSSEFDGLRVDKKIFGKCSSLLRKILNHKHGWVFNQPVDVERLGLHDYFDIIKHPMDLGTVNARLAKNWYKTPREFAEDVRLTFYNAMTYNPAGQDVHVMAQELLRMFEEKWSSIESEYDRILRYEMIRDMGVPTPTPTSRKTYAPARLAAPMSLDPPPLLHPVPPFQEARNLDRSQSMPVRPKSRPKPKPSYSVGRKPAPKKPKARDPHKRDMTFEEKQKLSTNLQSLPSQKLDSLVQIVRKNNSALSQHDDEIEVDIDSVDNETLWELDRFVTNYKKSLSKYKRKAEIAAQARAAAAQGAQARAVATQATQETIPANANVEATRETTAGQGNVAASPNVQQERHNNNASGSSSSSSSSSDSGSSSSDSDSDSSSSSDSDGGH